MRRFALVVGHDQGGEGAQRLRYAEHDAARMAALVVELGHMDPADVELLQGEGRRALSAAFRRMERAQRGAERNGDEVLFLFYYSGHADAEGLALGGAHYPFTLLEENIEALPTTASVMLVDACQSGSLARLKGGHRRAAFDISSSGRLRVQGSAVLTASAADEAAQESDAVRGSYFTHYVLAGLRGAADATRDGQVTLRELYQFTYERTVAATAASLSGAQHPAFSARWAGHGDLVLTTPSRGASWLRVPAGPPERYYVLDRDQERLIAEVERRPEHDVRIALPPGRYSLTRRRGAQYAQMPIALRARETERVDPGALRPVQLRRTVARGGLFRERHHVGLSGSVEIASPTIRGQRRGARAGVNARTWLRGRHLVGLGLSYGGYRVRDGGLRSRVHRLGLELGYGRRLSLAQWGALTPGLFTEGALWLQRFAMETRRVGGLRYGAWVRFEVGLRGLWALELDAKAGGALVHGSQGLRHVFSISGALGVALRWET